MIAQRLYAKHTCVMNKEAYLIAYNKKYETDGSVFKRLRVCIC